MFVTHLTDCASLVPSYFDATPIKRRVHGHLWQDLFHLDHSASYQIDLMLAAYFSRFEGGACTFDLDGPSLMTLRVKALQETQKAIEDPDRCVGLGVIVAIISSIFEAVSTEDIRENSGKAQLTCGKVRPRRRGHMQITSHRTKSNIGTARASTWSVITIQQFQDMLAGYIVSVPFVGSKNLRLFVERSSPGAR